MNQIVPRLMSDDGKRSVVPLAQPRDAWNHAQRRLLTPEL